MVRNGEGLTKTYNRFHDFYEHDSEITRLRELHDRMDRAVLTAYSWTSLAPTCDFRVDQEGSHGRSRVHHRWSDTVEEEVRGRLLTLNVLKSKRSQSRSRQFQSRLSIFSAKYSQALDDACPSSSSQLRGSCMPRTKKTDRVEQTNDMSGPMVIFLPAFSGSFP